MFSRAYSWKIVIIEKRERERESLNIEDMATLSVAHFERIGLGCTWRHNNGRANVRWLDISTTLGPYPNPIFLNHGSTNYQNQQATLPLLLPFQV